MRSCVRSAYLWHRYNFVAVFISCFARRRRPILCRPHVRFAKKSLPLDNSVSESDNHQRVYSKLNVITGATGLVGSHIAEQLRATGERVRALVRRGRDAAWLQNLGVELAEGDLLDQDSIARAFA